MNTPRLETERLILRKFTENDIEALYLILRDEDVNTFLPWFPLKSLDEAGAFYEARFAANYEKPQAYAYAICLKEDNHPIGYINVAMDESHDINNPRSGGVMKQVGMKYQYSYEELWQPKNFPVTFRMYQLNFDEKDNRVFTKYWNNSTVHFIETEV